MIMIAPDTMNTKLRRGLWALLLVALWLIPGLLAPPAARAHGGVIVDGGLTDEQEWLMAVSPYPATPGDTVLTLLIYDLDDYSPVNGLDAQLYLTPPDSDTATGPYELLADPEQFPGDYSNILPIDQEGRWAVTFVVNTGEETLELTSQFIVQPGDPNRPRPTAEGAADVAATATAFAQNVNAARQTGSRAAGTAVPTQPQSVAAIATSSTFTQTSAEQLAAREDTAPEDVALDMPGAANTAPALPETSRVWLWGILAVVPFALVFLWFLRGDDGADAERDRDDDAVQDEDEEEKQDGNGMQTPDSES
jgi:hypothetical protein